jgi:hypothetical protein
MPRARRGLGALLALALMSAPVLSGCGGSEPSAAPIAAARSVIDGVVGELKREDDEADRNEIRETSPHGQEDRELAREQNERTMLEAHQAEAEESEAG